MVPKMRTVLLQAGILLMVLSAPPALAEVLVQVMSVQEEAAAEKEATRLFNLGVPAFSRAEEAGDIGLRNRVYVGPFETEADALAAAEVLKKNGTIKEFLVKNLKPEGAVPAGSRPTPQLSTEASAEPRLSDPVEESIAGLPAASANLPVAETPTYGEPVSPEQALSLGLDSAAGQPQPETAPSSQTGIGFGPAKDLPTYGQVEATWPAPAESSLPPGLKAGDDLPPSTGGILPPPPPPPPPVSENGLVTAPSAGDGSRPASFEFLMDLSSSMRRASNCRGLTKEEAIIQLSRKINRNIPNHPYQAALRVFGYKPALTRADFTTLYFGPSGYSREGFESAIGRIAVAEAITPFSDALRAAEQDLLTLPPPKNVLMFSDFQESVGSGKPLEDVRWARRRHGPALTVFTFYVTRVAEAERLAKNLAKLGGGEAWNICTLLSNEQAFENMMLTVFGPGGDYVCRNAPLGAEVDERGCWIAAYAQFFDFNKAEVKSEYMPRLAEAARIIRENVDPGERVVIAGFTDNIGSQEFNLALGRRRAQAVANILVSEGVSASRLSVVSFGLERPIADNSTPEGRAKNRRVEFHVGGMPQ